MSECLENFPTFITGLGKTPSSPRPGSKMDRNPSVGAGSMPRVRKWRWGREGRLGGSGMLPWGRSMGCAGGHIGDTSGASVGVLARLEQVYQFRDNCVLAWSH